MYCLTRYEMKFRDKIIPARTKAIVITNLTNDVVDTSGVRVRIMIDNFILNEKNIDNENRVEKYRNNVNEATLSGIIIDTNTQAVYMGAEDKIYNDTQLCTWQLEKIFGNNIPNKLLIIDPIYVRYTRKYAMFTNVIEYLEDEFSEWVQNNCEFRDLTEEDIENGDCIDGAEIGDRTLSENGLEQFYKKKLEYQNKLETIGFTYDFQGGLIWE